MRRTLWATTAIAIMVAVPAAYALASPGETTLLRADVNRDGQLTSDDDAGRDEWNADRGAIMLPNLDDDADRCGTDQALPDDDLAGCHDAADEIVNGTADIDDLAKMRVLPVSAESATVSVDGPARVFARLSGDFIAMDDETRLSAEQLAAGVDLYIEALDIIRDLDQWNGIATVSLNLTGTGNATSTDTVAFRVAPLLLENKTMPVEQLLVADTGDSPRPQEELFQQELRDGLADSVPNAELIEYPTNEDIWLQDLFEPGYVAMPGADGSSQHMRVLIRTANANNPQDWSPQRPLRDTARAMYWRLQGPDVAVIHQYDPERGGDPEQFVNGTFDSGGNFDAIPPSAGDPLGRMLYGASEGTDFAPDRSFTRMLAAQGYQEPVVVDTAWLAVGHVDEFLTFAPADNAQGWVAVVADPRLGMELLSQLESDGHGNEYLVSEVNQADTEDPGLTVAEAAAKPTLLSGADIAAAGLDAALAVLADEVGLQESQIVRVPGLFNEIAVDDYPREGMVYNYLPGAANGVATGTGTYLAPRQHGPLDDGDADTFGAAVDQALTEVGTTVAWVETWQYSHRFGTVGGEVDCVTNTLRDVSTAAPWWR